MREMINYRDYLIKELSDPEEAIVYLEVSIEEYQKDGDTVAFLLALQSIAEAQAGNNELLPKSIYWAATFTAHEGSMT